MFLLGENHYMKNFNISVRNEKIAAYLHGDTDYYYIIHAQMPKINKPAKYSIIQKNNNIRISKMDVPDLFKTYVRENTREVTFENYLKTFYISMDNRFCSPRHKIVPKVKNKFKKKKTKLALKGK